MSKIVQLYYDNKNTIKAYPRTTTSCVFDESGKSVKEQLDNKASKNEVFTMANMGQDIRESMTGGSVAVVGKGSVLNETIVPKQVSFDKTDFIKTGKNIFDKNDIGEMGWWCNYANGVIETNQYVFNYYHSSYKHILPNTTYTRKYGNDGTVFFDVNRVFISGTQQNTFRTPSNACYVIFNCQNVNLTTEQIELGNTSTIYEDFKLECDNLKVPNTNITGLQSYTQTNFVTTGKNLFNKDTVSNRGMWINYSNGIKEVYPSNPYIQAFRYSDIISVKPNTTYTRRDGIDVGQCFLDKNDNFISGCQGNTFTTPLNCYYLIMNVRDGYEVEQLEEGGIQTPYESYRLKFITDTSVGDDEVIIGEGGHFKKITEGFEYANRYGKSVRILPGVYDLVAENPPLNNSGLNLPKKLTAYGVTVLANLPTENWIWSPFNINPSNNHKIEVYGLTVISNNCRYCLHDDMGTTKNHHHIFKDLTLINNGKVSDVLLAPRAIGGGTGSNGYIEIENCVFASNTNADIDYHSDWGNTQSADTVIKCKDSVFKTTISATSIGGDTSFKNKMYVSSCKLNTKPTLIGDTNFEIIEWNNTVTS